MFGLLFLLSVYQASESETVATVDSPVAHHSGSQTHSSLGAGMQLSLRKKTVNSSVLCDDNSIQESSYPSKPQHRKGSGHKRNNKRVAERVLGRIHKRQKKMTNSDTDSIGGGCLRLRDMKLRSNSKKNASSSQKKAPKSRITRKYHKKETSAEGKRSSGCVEVKKEKDAEKVDSPTAVGDRSSHKEEFIDENICGHEAVGNTWKVIEKSLLEKGIEIFGRNRSV